MEFNVKDAYAVLRYHSKSYFLYSVVCFFLLVGILHFSPKRFNGSLDIYIDYRLICGPQEIYCPINDTYILAQFDHIISQAPQELSVEGSEVISDWDSNNAIKDLISLNLRKTDSGFRLFFSGSEKSEVESLTVMALRSLDNQLKARRIQRAANVVSMLQHVADIAAISSPNVLLENLNTSLYLSSDLSAEDILYFKDEIFASSRLSVFNIPVLIFIAVISFTGIGLVHVLRASEAGVVYTKETLQAVFGANFIGQFKSKGGEAENTYTYSSIISFVESKPGSCICFLATENFDDLHNFKNITLGILTRKFGTPKSENIINDVIFFQFTNEELNSCFTIGFGGYPHDVLITDRKFNGVHQIFLVSLGESPINKLLEYSNFRSIDNLSGRTLVLCSS